MITSSLKSSGSRKIKLALLTSLDIQLQLKVRDIRNEDNVRKWMYTDNIIDVDEHLNWIKQLKHDDKQIVFVVLDEIDALLGLVSVNALNLRHQTTNWAYYLTNTERRGLGSAIEFSFINFVFNTLGIKKLNCEVIEGNNAVVKMHKKFLFKEEGFRRSNISKNGARMGVHFLGLTNEDWLEGKTYVQEKYKTVFDKFAISIQWKS